MNKGGREFPVADISMFDTIPHKSIVADRSEDTPLSVRVQEILSTMPEHLQMVYYFRFVELMPIRKIASQMGYESHFIIQYYLEQIKDIVRDALEQSPDSPS